MHHKLFSFFDSLKIDFSQRHMSNSERRGGKEHNLTYIALIRMNVTTHNKINIGIVEHFLHISLHGISITLMGMVRIVPWSM
jgi:hypothetical protein